MSILLEAINFNHNQESATADALNVRKNNTEFIEPPEWLRSSGNAQPGPRSLPAAYARDLVGANTITIRAQFKRLPGSTLETVEICAVDGHSVSPSRRDGACGVPVNTTLNGLGVNVLGTVKSRSVMFGDNGETGLEEFELENVRIAEAGVSVSEVVWRWHFRRDPEDEWTYFDTSTHRIYTVLNVPSCPWVQLPFEEGNTQLPWTDVLDHACNWASSAQDTDDAATRVTRRLNALGQDGVFKHDGEGCFVDSKTDNFKCTEFLAALQRCAKPATLINCTDCATVVSTFSNSLGCDLWQSQLGNNFETNNILRIGHPSHIATVFNYHEVAWEGNATLVDELYDACLTLDANPKTPAFEPLLPVNIPFAGRSQSYRDLLGAPVTIQRCQPHPCTRVRRVIGQTPLRVKKFEREQLDLVAEFYDFNAWSGEEIPPGNQPFIWNFSPHGDDFRGWTLESIRRAPGAEGLPPSVKTTWRREDSEEFLHADVYECANLKEARHFLLDLLTAHQLLDMERRTVTDGDESVSVEDVLFVASVETAAFLANGNHVVSVRRCQENSLRPLELALLFGEYLSSKPDSEGWTIVSEMEKFYLSDAYFALGQPVPIRMFPPDPSEQPFHYRFFPTQGTVALEGGRLIYRAERGGPQSILIFAVDSGHRALRQELHFILD